MIADKVGLSCHIQLNTKYGNFMNSLNISSFPLRVEIELSSACNLKCTYCPRHYLPNIGEMIDIRLFQKLISEMQEYPQTILTLHRRGESLLHPNFNELMGMVSGKFKEIQLATNCTLLTEEKFESIVNGLSFISFSIDVPHRFNSTRLGADYETVEKNIINFLKFNKKRIKTQVSMVRTNLTEQYECDEFISIWKNKVDRIRIYEEHSKNGIFGSTENVRIERKPCIMPFYEILIYADGTVGRCNHDWNGTRLGNTHTQSIKDIWDSDELNSLRYQHKNLIFTDPVCMNCDSWYPEYGIQGTGEVIEENL